MMTKLPKIFKKKWVAALRSGKFLQAESTLFETMVDGKPEMCCLGVAEYVCGTPLNELKDAATPRGLKNPKSPLLIRCDDTNPNDVGWKLATFNDNKKSFNWIASYIERYL